MRITARNVNLPPVSLPISGPLPQRCHPEALSSSANLFPASLSARLWPSVLKMAFGSVSLRCLRACLVHGPENFIREGGFVSRRSANMSIHFLQTSRHCRATFSFDTQLENWTITSSWNQVNILANQHIDMQRVNT